MTKFRSRPQIFERTVRLDDELEIIAEELLKAAEKKGGANAYAGMDFGEKEDGEEQGFSEGEDEFNVDTTSQKKTTVIFQEENNNSASRKTSKTSIQNARKSLYQTILPDKEGRKTVVHQGQEKNTNDNRYEVPGLIYNDIKFSRIFTTNGITPGAWDMEEQHSVSEGLMNAVFKRQIYCKHAKHAFYKWIEEIIGPSPFRLPSVKDLAKFEAMFEGDKRPETKDYRKNHETLDGIMKQDSKASQTSSEGRRTVFEGNKNACKPIIFSEYTTGMLKGVVVIRESNTGEIPSQLRYTDRSQFIQDRNFL